MHFICKFNRKHVLLVISFFIHYDIPAFPSCAISIFVHFTDTNLKGTNDVQILNAVLVQILELQLLAQSINKSENCFAYPLPKCSSPHVLDQPRYKRNNLLLVQMFKKVHKSTRLNERTYK